jgi:hypothetical protein
MNEVKGRLSTKFESLPFVFGGVSLNADSLRE